jgi:hypothetical protein
MEFAMSVTIENCSDKVVTIRFNNQVSKHMAPGQKLSDIASSLVAGNELIKKLQERQLITVDMGDGKAGKEKKAAAKPKSSSEETAKSPTPGDKPGTAKSAGK